VKPGRPPSRVISGAAARRLRLRGRTSLGTPSVKVVTDYAGRLDDVGRLYRSGLQPDLTRRRRRTGSVEGPVRAFEATRSSVK